MVELQNFLNAPRSLEAAACDATHFGFLGDFGLVPFGLSWLTQPMSHTLLIINGFNADACNNSNTSGQHSGILSYIY